MGFTQTHKEKAIMMESIICDTLARHFVSEADSAISSTMMENDKFQNLSDDEQLDAIEKALDSLTALSKKTDLLFEIKNGKYRLLLMALAKGEETMMEAWMKGDDTNGEDRADGNG